MYIYIMEVIVIQITIVKNVVAVGELLEEHILSDEEEDISIIKVCN